MKKRNIPTWAAGLVLCILLLFVSGVAYAATNPAAIPWWTVAGGGGTSSGTGYSLNGTIGQADAGAMAGGNYHLAGGFWGGAAGGVGVTIYLPLIER